MTSPAPGQAIRPRILHSVEVFLPVTQNWIYPQVAQIPGVDSAVLCRQHLRNTLAFPYASGRIFSQTLGGPGAPSVPARLLRGVLRRAGWPAATIARFRAGWWRPTILHAHFGPRGWEAISLCRNYDVPLVTSFYGADAWSLPVEQPIWRERYAELFVEGSLFLAEGPAMRQRLIDLGCAPEKVQVQRIGVQPVNFNFDERKFAKGLKIAMIGRFMEKKGFVDGLRACADARESGVDLSVTIVGDALAENVASVAIKYELLKLANSAALSGRVRFAGFLPQAETRALLEQHDVLLCPSKHASNGDAEGGSPVVLTESMALGLLCIGSRHCDIPEVIVDRQTGYLFDEGSVSQLTDILRALPGSSERIPDLVRAGRRHVEERFNLVHQLQTLGDRYAELLR